MTILIDDIPHTTNQSNFWKTNGSYQKALMNWIGIVHDSYRLAAIPPFKLKDKKIENDLVCLDFNW